MELFYSSYSSSSSTSTPLPSSLLDSLSPSTTPIPGNPSNLLRLLQVAQILRVPLLPLTWDPALEPIGRDGSAGSISQSPLNASLSFAYKRFNPTVTRNDMSTPAFRKMQYDAMIDEMTIFSHRGIRRHPNVVNFVGLCFEIHKTDGIDKDEVWPVLVFTKADLGDLYTFLMGNGPFALETSMEICRDVARGIEVMHRHGVINGDIKPTNILIEDVKDTDDIQVKVADFGFSSFQSTGDSGLRVGRTPPWEAPEWHSRYFSLASAKAMDMYSFGLLCLWVLFGQQDLTELGEPFVSVNEALFSTDKDITDRVQALKRTESSLVPAASRLLRQLPDLDNEYRGRLARLFALTLCLDPEERAKSMAELVEILDVQGGTDKSSKQKVSDVLDSVVLPQWHGAFETGNVFFQLETSDFRIPEYIAKALKAMSEGDCCTVCQTNAAFQLAVCHSIGFGIVPDNDTERDRLLDTSGKQLSSLEEVLDQIRIRTETMMPKFMSDLYRRGHRETVLDRYRASGLLLEAASKHRAIASLRDKVFGPTHYSTMRAKMNLVGILCYTQSFQEALPIALETIRNASGSAITVRDQLTLKTQLSFIYSHMSRLEEAETILRKVIEHWDGRPEDRGSNQGYYYEQTLLADILLDKGDSKQALELALETEKDVVLALGPYHQASISAARVVVGALDAEGQPDSAVWLHEKLLETIEKCHEANDGVVIQQLAILALQYYRLERIDDAKRCHDRIQGLVTQDVNNASPAISAVDKYARIMGNAGKHAEATMFAERLQEEVDKLLGPDDQQSAKLRGNHVTRYFQQQRYAEAEALGRRVLEYNRRVFGAKHHETLFALDTLAVTLMCRWRWAEAASLAQESFEIRDSFDDTPDKTRLSLLSMIGRGLTLSHAYEKAIGFWGRFLDVMQRDDTGNAESGPSLHLRDMVLATVCCAKLRQRPLARRRMKLVVDTIQRPWGDAPAAIVHHLTNLAKTCDENNWQVETEQALVAATLVVEAAAEYLEATELVIRRLDAAITNFFDKTGKSELVFKPEELEDEMLASAMSGLAIG